MLKRSSLFIVLGIPFSVHATIPNNAAHFGAFGIPVIAGAISLAKEDNEGLWMFAEGASYTLVATHSVKRIADQERPNGEAHSFPSGHTSSVTQGAAYLQFRYGWEYGVPAYIGAAMTGVSRVQNDHHYWRDVFAGAALATGIQYLVTEKWEQDESLALVPVLNTEYFGLQASFSF